jgi:hypothetical protein
VIYFLFLFT